MSTILHLYIDHQFPNLLGNKQTDHINIFYQNQYFYLYILIQFKYFNEIKGSVNIFSQYSFSLYSPIFDFCFKSRFLAFNLPDVKKMLIFIFGFSQKVDL